MKIYFVINLNTFEDKALSRFMSCGYEITIFLGVQD